MLARNSPKLIAACYVLHRLSVPRHSPNALQRLIAKLSYAGANPRILIPQYFSLYAANHGTKFRPCSLARGGRNMAGAAIGSKSAHSIHNDKELVVEFPPIRPPESEPKLLFPTSSNGRDFTHPVFKNLVEVNGIEPMTSCLQSRRSPN